MSKVIETIKEHQPIHLSKLAELLDMPKEHVSSQIRQLRKSFFNGDLDFYIYLTTKGYTLDESKDGVAFESRLRFKSAIGGLLNGMYVFKRCRAIAPSDWHKLTIVYKPQAMLPFLKKRRV